MTFDEMLKFRHDSIIGSMRIALKYAEQYRGTMYAVMLDEKNGHPFVVDMSLAGRLKSDGIMLETFQLGKYEKPSEWSDAELETTLKSAAYEVKRDIGEYADFPEFNIRLHPRVESYAQLADVMSPTRYQKINSEEYSDITLSTLADFKAEYSAIIADSKFSPQTINKLCKAYLEDKISDDDLIMATKYSDNNSANERYVDDFLKSIDNGLYHETAAKVFAAVGYGDQTFNEAVSLVKSGAFYPTDYADLSVSEDVARALHELRYPLRACEGFDLCYDIDDGLRLQAALDRNSAIFVTDKSLALAVNELIDKPDWYEFCNVISNSGEAKSDFTAEKLMDRHLAFLDTELSKKVNAEYKQFLANINTHPTDIIFKSAYEMTWKDSINEFITSEVLNLSEKQLYALMSSKNILDEIYEQWCQNGALDSYSDTEYSLQETADRILISREHDNRPLEFITAQDYQNVKVVDNPRQTERKAGMNEPLITVSRQSGTNDSFDVTSVGFDTEKKYTVAEFNQALKKADEKWLETWDGISYPNDIVIVTIENLHNDPCTYRFNFSDAEFHSIQEIVSLSTTPMHASLTTEKAIEKLNTAEAIASELDKTFAYEIGHSAPFTVVHLAIGTDEQKKAVSEALKNIINNHFGEKNAMSQPYKNLLDQIKPATEYIHASQGHLSTLKYALRNAETDKELCLSMLDSIKRSEKNLTDVITIKGYECLPKDAWEEQGVTYNIGQSVDDMSFYYARATDGKITRDYEYGYEPNRVKVMSDHANKLAEEAIDRHEAEYGADGKRVFSNNQNNTVENVPKQRDISHSTINAALSATGGKDKTMATKMECTGMVMLSEGKAKALAQVTINDEFVIKGIKVYEGEKGLSVLMPSHKIGSKYQNVAFPVTAEARAQLNGTVLETYGKLVEKGLEKLPLEKKDPPEKSTSKIKVQLSLFQSDNEAQKNIKAVGQIKIDDCIVISEVAIKHGTNQEGVEKDFISMPSYKSQSEDGEYVYKEYAFPTTKECYEKVNKAVFDKFETLKKTEYKGVKLSELGEKGELSSKCDMNNIFAGKLMNELDKKGIPYSAAVAKKTSLTIKKSDIAAFDQVQNALKSALTAKKDTQNQQQPKPKKAVKH